MRKAHKSTRILLAVEFIQQILSRGREHTKNEQKPQAPCEVMDDREPAETAGRKGDPSYRIMAERIAGELAQLWDVPAK